MHIIDIQRNTLFSNSLENYRISLLKKLENEISLLSPEAKTKECKYALLSAYRIGTMVLDHNSVETKMVENGSGNISNAKRYLSSDSMIASPSMAMQYRIPCKGNEDVLYFVTQDGCRDENDARVERWNERFFINIKYQASKEMKGMSAAIRTEYEKTLKLLKDTVHKNNQYINKINIEIEALILEAFR